MRLANAHPNCQSSGRSAMNACYPLFVNDESTKHQRRSKLKSRGQRTGEYRFSCGRSERHDKGSWKHCKVPNRRAHIKREDLAAPTRQHGHARPTGEADAAPDYPGTPRALPRLSWAYAPFIRAFVASSKSLRTCIRHKHPDRRLPHRLRRRQSRTL